MACSPSGGGGGGRRRIGSRDREAELGEAVEGGVGDLGEKVAMAELGRAVAPEDEVGQFGADAGR